MTTQNPSIASGIANSASRPAGPSKGLIAEIATFWREFFKTAFVPYYPQRHYMRGPGPACAAKRKAAG